jgi:hypothetical protein
MRTLAELEPRQCHWPVTDPGAGLMDTALFCAQEAMDDCPYCPIHNRAAHQRTQPKSIRTAKRFAAIRAALRRLQSRPKVEEAA